MNVSDWHKHLETHFQKVRQSRFPEYPVYAIEHGLDKSQRNDLSQAIWAVLKEDGRLGSHFLPWVVYATEIGYEYSGDEYWQTFEGYTPGWAKHGDRNWIRHFFRRFQEIFHGAQPSGSWASQFTIICWPITHAILPRDLQLQLAKLLYDLRFSFRPEHIESPDQLGELIGAHSLGMTSRFRQFTQDTYLVGRISAALLFQDKQGAESLIHPTTLSRIAKNIDESQNAQEWLSDARRVTHKLDFKGFRSRARREELSNISRSDISARVNALSLEPCLLLQRDSHGVWKPLLRIPDLAPLTMTLPQIRRVLDTARCRVPTAARRTPFPRGFLLYGSQSVPLKRWPQPNEDLISFESPDDVNATILSSIFRIPPNDSWLFKIGSDNFARTLKSRSVRPGEKYILVTNESVAVDEQAGTRVPFECEGACAWELMWGDDTSPDLLERLRRMDLALASSVRIWPSGLPADDMSQDGQAQWLTTDVPIVALMTDAAVPSIKLVLDSREQEAIVLQQNPAMIPVYLQLSNLTAGKHRLEVYAETASGSTCGEYWISIREPRPWIPGTQSQGSFRVYVEPTLPSLEDLWEGRVGVDMTGPQGQKAKLRIEFFERQSNRPFFSKNLPSIGLPATTAKWREVLQKHFCESSDVQNQYDLANSCHVRLDAGILGRHNIRFERRLTPLRWRLTRNQNEFTLQLIDDGDPEQPLAVEHATFGHPDHMVALDAKMLMHGVVDAGEGGLYLARRHSEVTGIIVPQHVRSFIDLKPDLVLSPCRRTVPDIRRLIRVWSYWEMARLPGSAPATISRSIVLNDILIHMVGCIAGEKWLSYERANGNREFVTLLADLKGQISQRKEQQAIAVLLERDSARLPAMNDLDKIKYMRDLVDRYHIVDDVKHDIRSFGRNHSLDDMSVRDPTKWICEFAIRFCRAPNEFCNRTDEEVELGTNLLINTPILVRLARYLVLTSELSTPALAPERSVNKEESD